MHSVIAWLNEVVRPKLPSLLQPRTWTKSDNQFYHVNSIFSLKKLVYFIHMQHIGHIHGLGSLNDEWDWSNLFKPELSLNSKPEHSGLLINMIKLQNQTYKPFCLKMHQQLIWSVQSIYVSYLNSFNIWELWRSCSLSCPGLDLRPGVVCITQFTIEKEVTNTWSTNPFSSPEKGKIRW